MTHHLAIYEIAHEMALEARLRPDLFLRERNPVIRAIGGLYHIVEQREDKTITFEFFVSCPFLHRVTKFILVVFPCRRNAMSYRKINRELDQVAGSYSGNFMLPYVALCWLGCNEETCPLLHANARQRHICQRFCRMCVIIFSQPVTYHLARYGRMKLS